MLKTFVEGEVSFSYMNYRRDYSGFWGHNKGQTFQWQALTGLRYYFVGESHRNRPYMTLLTGYSFMKDEAYRDGRLWTERLSSFQLLGTVNLEIKKHFVLTIGFHSVPMLSVARIGYQF
jgi:outer membrane protein W